jgi:hypothetical protein
MSVVRLAASVLATSLLLVFAGCVHPNVQQKPATMTAPGIIILDPDKVQTKDEIAKALAQVAKDYRTHADSGQFAQAKIDRNRFVFTIMGQIEASYGDFEHSFRSRRAAVETITDAALLGVSAAATVVGEAGIKDMLSAASVAGNGTRLSAEKNFFNEEGTIALLTQMRASRSTIEAQIIKRCGDEVTSLLTGGGMEGSEQVRQCRICRIRDDSARGKCGKPECGCATEVRRRHCIGNSCSKPTECCGL